MKMKALNRGAAAVIVAGGSGKRMDVPVRKQYLPLADEPILIRTLRVFDACPAIRCIILVVPPDDVTYCDHQFLSRVDFKNPIRVVSGGAERQDSVLQGLHALGPEHEWVVIHDAVRPFVTEKNIEDCLEGAKETGACILATPASDTVKEADSTGRILRTLSREGLWLAQTPQVFLTRLILDAHEAARKEGIQGTDDSFLLERIGIRVRIVAGSRLNFKITTNEDLALAEAIIRK
jgi:2-C-methyl-D-erythritol 4-phosphate cytidylyltransferase